MATYKLKTKRATATRMRSTGNGGVKFGRAGKRHLLTGRSKNAKRQLRANGHLKKQDAKLVLASAPYGLPK